MYLRTLLTEVGANKGNCKRKLLSQRGSRYAMPSSLWWSKVVGYQTELQGRRPVDYGRKAIKTGETDASRNRNFKTDAYLANSKSGVTETHPSLKSVHRPKALQQVSVEGGKHKPVSETHHQSTR